MRSLGSMLVVVLLSVSCVSGSPGPTSPMAHETVTITGYGSMVRTPLGPVPKVEIRYASLEECRRDPRVDRCVRRWEREVPGVGACPCEDQASGVSCFPIRLSDDFARRQGHGRGLLRPDGTQSGFVVSLTATGNLAVAMDAHGPYAMCP